MKRKRDPDLLRALILEIEEGRTDFHPEAYEDGGEPGRWDKTVMHLELLSDGGLVVFDQEMETWFVVRITSRGHDFLDSVRDPAIWEKAKDGASKAGGFTVDLLGALAKGFIKKQVHDRTGIDLDI